jgi:isoleucyl-tRNA synthetase
VISPLEVADKRGAEILRLWVSMIDFLEDMRLSQEILDRNAEAYRKIRNTFRYLLGNLAGFDPATDAVPPEAMQEIDRWALHQLESLRSVVVNAYEAHRYHVVYHALNAFVTVTLSSFYLDVLKDRLYTSPRTSPERRSAQTVLWRMASELSRLAAPILCFTAEEIWQELEALQGRPRWGTSSVHAQVFPEPSTLPADPALLSRWDRLASIRELVMKALEGSKVEKKIGGSLEAQVAISGPEETLAFLRSFGDDLRFLFLTSGVTFGATADTVSVTVGAANGVKCQRCWNYTEDVGSDPEWPGACARCSRAVRLILAEASR